MTSYRHVTEIREHMVEIRKCCNVWPMFVRLKLGLKMLQLPADFCLERKHIWNDIWILLMPF